MDVPQQPPLQGIYEQVLPAVQEMGEADKQAREIAERARRAIEQGTVDQANRMGWSGQGN